MNSYPEYVEVNGKQYKINTDFRVAIECNRIAEDETINDYERVLGVLCTLFGEDGINEPRHYETLLKWALKYLSGGVETKNKYEKPDIDLIEDKKYIVSSFKYDYKYNPYEMEYLSWEDFYNDLSNLSNSEFGNCCILNRVRQLRNFDVSKIKDQKEKQKIIEAKKMVELKKYKKPKKPLTEEQRKNASNFFKALGLERS